MGVYTGGDGFGKEVARINKRKDHRSSTTTHQAFELMLEQDAEKKGEKIEEGVSLGVIKKFLAFLRLIHDRPSTASFFVFTATSAPKVRFSSGTKVEKTMAHGEFAMNSSLPFYLSPPVHGHGCA
ncbi:hypothetical protein F441_06502 [Phytophthora nicotianae CJ01A1]|nr:hypothetical protein L915_06702 [Phytophthora nicotianae]ETL46047.1 hypothetical protein L916_03995 [Phytophthora nicotianae]ETP19472.1 hypothetical protein F441_06502 [Phytophthora nicotianae CJ01A1]